MARESIQNKLSKVRPPRVHITYDVEIGDATELKELPFVMGVLADLSGKPEQKRLEERKFVEVTPDNFDDVLKQMNPRVEFAVPNKLSSDANAGQLKIDLTFERLADFEPEQVAKKVAPLNELLELRRNLADLRGSLQGNPKFDDLLNKIANDAGQRRQLSGELGLEEGKGRGDKNA